MNLDRYRVEHCTQSTVSFKEVSSFGGEIHNSAVDHVVTIDPSGNAAFNQPMVFKVKQMQEKFCLIVDGFFELRPRSRWLGSGMLFEMNQYFMLQLFI